MLDMFQTDQADAQSPAVGQIALASNTFSGLPFAQLPVGGADVKVRLHSPTLACAHGWNGSSSF